MFEHIHMGESESASPQYKPVNYTIVLYLFSAEFISGGELTLPITAHVHEQMGLANVQLLPSITTYSCLL